MWKFLSWAPADNAIRMVARVRRTLFVVIVLCFAQMYTIKHGAAFIFGSKPHMFVPMGRSIPALAEKCQYLTII